MQSSELPGDSNRYPDCIPRMADQSGNTTRRPGTANVVPDLRLPKCPEHALGRVVLYRPTAKQSRVGRACRQAGSVRRVFPCRHASDQHDWTLSFPQPARAPRIYGGGQGLPVHNRPRIHHAYPDGAVGSVCSCSKPVTGPSRLRHVVRHSSFAARAVKRFSSVPHNIIFMASGRPRRR